MTHQKLNQLQLFNIARVVSGMSQIEFCSSFKPPIPMAAVSNVLRGRYRNPAIEAKVESFITEHLMELLAFFINKYPEAPANASKSEKKAMSKINNFNASKKETKT